MDGEARSNVGYGRETGENMLSSRFTAHDPNRKLRVPAMATGCKIVPFLLTDQFDLLFWLAGTEFNSINLKRPKVYRAPRRRRSHGRSSPAGDSGDVASHRFPWPQLSFDRKPTDRRFLSSDYASSARSKVESSRLSIGRRTVSPSALIHCRQLVCYNPTLTVPKAGSKPREMGLIAHSPISRSPMSCDTLSNTS
jgi:hypothetical protein